MPTIRRTRKRPRRTKKTARRKTAIPRSLTSYNTNIGLPLTKKVKLSYYETIGLASTSGVAAKHTFNLSGVFDPDVTGVGHQPYGHDQWANMYRHYYVSSARITVKWSNIATNNIPHIVGITLDKDNSIDPTLDTRQEKQKGRSIKTLLANSNNVQTVAAVYSPRSFFGIKDPSDDHQIKALLTADPTLPAYAVIWIQPYDTVSSTSAFVYGEVHIDYNVVLYDPVDFAGS